jgi:hypothetical protein
MMKVELVVERDMPVTRRRPERESRAAPTAHRRLEHVVR